MTVPANEEQLPTPASWAKLLKSGWELRAASPRRDFYIASHNGWSDPDVRRRQAEVDTTMILLDLSPEFVRTASFLEIGSGIGRLAEILIPRVASYTGIDISSEHVRVATERYGHLGARFMETNGISIPPAALDRRYDVIFALAVLIHCPLPVIDAMVGAALDALAPKGRLRVQFFADPNNLEGLSAVAAADVAASLESEIRGPMTEQKESEDAALTTDHYYEGHRFLFPELKSFAESKMRGRGVVHLLRFDPLFIYVEWQRE